MAELDVDAGTPKHLADKYAVVGVGETAFMRGNGSGRSTRALGTQAVRAAIVDAGLTPADIDGMLSYSNNDSTFAPMITSPSATAAQSPSARPIRA